MRLVMHVDHHRIEQKHGRKTNRRYWRVEHARTAQAIERSWNCSNVNMELALQFRRGQVEKQEMKGKEKNKRMVKIYI